MWFTRILFFAALSHAAAAQVPGADAAKAPPPPAQPEDPLGRSTPRGTITGFTDAVHQGDLATASRYLQLSDTQRQYGDTLARKLSQLMDRYYGETIQGIEDSPAGALDDGLPGDRERVGPIVMDNKTVQVELARVTDSVVGPVWLISSETLREVPALHRSIKSTWYERAMPEAFVRPALFGVSLAQWIVLVASIVVPAILLRLLFAAIMAVAKRAAATPSRRAVLESAYASIRWPTIIVLTLAVHLSYMPFMRLPLVFRMRYGRLALVVLVVAVAWLIRALLQLASERAQGMMGSTHTGARSLIMLAARMMNAVVVVVAVLAVLTICGVDTKTALAGLGIGGVALALGAQKSVENLLGGVFLLSDRALAVGDTCSISNRVGVVEDITLRSVRLRTAEQTLLSIPAGTLSASSVENFATRAKILLQTRLHLHSAISVAQLRTTLSEIEKLLASHPELEPGTSRIRLIDFAATSVEVELFTFVMTSDDSRFLQVRQDVLLQVAEIVESQGRGLAQAAPPAPPVDRKPAVDAPVRTPLVRDDVPVAQS